VSTCRTFTTPLDRPVSDRCSNGAPMAAHRPRVRRGLKGSDRSPIGNRHIDQDPFCESAGRPSLGSGIKADERAQWALRMLAGLAMAKGFVEGAGPAPWRAIHFAICPGQHPTTH